MPEIRTAGVETLGNYLEWLADIEQQERQQALQKLPEFIQPRILFESNLLISQWPARIIYGLIRFAVEEYEADPWFDLTDCLKCCLRDGWVLFYFYSSGKWRQEDPELVHEIDFVESRNAIRRLVIRFEMEPPDDAPRDERWIREEIYEQQMADGSEASVTWVQMVAEYKESTPEKDREYETEILSRWPWRAVRWKEKCSILEKPMRAILRYEAALYDLGMDNDRHAKRKMVYQGGGELQKMVDRANVEGYYKIGRQEQLGYMNSQPYSFEPVRFELEVLEAHIRGCTGLVEMKDVHNASGRSKLVQIKPMLAQAKNIREISQEIANVLSSKLSLPPLVEMDPQEVAIMMTNLQTARAEKAITEPEYTKEIRMMFNLIAEDTVGEGDDKPDIQERQAILPVDYAE